MTQVGRAAMALGVVAAVAGLGCAGARSSAPGAALPTSMKMAGVEAKIGKPGIGVDAHKMADDNTRAAAILAELMLHHPEEGFRVLTVGSEGVGVARGPFKFLIQPRINGVGKVNRFVVKQFYEVKPAEAKNAARLQELCFELNTTMPFLKASILNTARGPLFVAESEISFGDTILLSDLGTYLDELKHETLSQGGKRMATYLK
jgi:hypothetical protein